ncbi:MAG: hypothetical protein U0840_03565 [Gemmataceae bacterium]
MADEPIILPQQVEPQVVEAHGPAADQPIPTRDEERVADGIFSPDQEQALATVMAVQTSMAFLHHLANETFNQPHDDEEEARRRRLKLQAPPRQD